MTRNSRKSRTGLVAAVPLTVLLVMLGIAAASSPNPPSSSSAQVQSAATLNALTPAATTESVQAPSVQPEQNEPQQAKAQPVQSEQKNDLSNDSHYTNSSGNIVHAPAYDLDSDVPAGASAKCEDGTYSFSEHRRGTCSRHGG